MGGYGGVRGMRSGWVEDLTECTNDNTFEAIKEMVTRDVEEMNKAHFDRPDCRFEIKEETTDDETTITVQRILENDSSNPHSVNFTKTAHSIRVHVGVPGAGNSFLVRTEWNLKTASCVFRVGEENMQIWEISHKALSPLLLF